MKVIRIDCCFRCPKYRVSAIKAACVCEAVSPETYVEDPANIPEWCPLPDEEGGKS
jgi:hypothetical protein